MDNSQVVQNRCVFTIFFSVLNFRNFVNCTLAVDLLATFLRDLATLKIDSAIVNFRIFFESHFLCENTMAAGMEERKQSQDVT